LWVEYIVRPVEIDKKLFGLLLFIQPVVPEDIADWCRAAEWLIACLEVCALGLLEQHVIAHALENGHHSRSKVLTCALR
jgi:hypothetical protein